QILEQLRARQVAEERILTYAQQEKAAKQERELRQAESLAAQQTKLTESEVSIAIQTNQGRAEYQRSLQEAARVKAMAEAEASMMESLLAMLLSERMLQITSQPNAAPGPEVAAIKGQILQSARRPLAANGAERGTGA